MRGHPYALANAVKAVKAAIHHSTYRTQYNHRHSDEYYPRAIDEARAELARLQAVRDASETTTDPPRLRIAQPPALAVPAAASSRPIPTHVP